MSGTLLTLSLLAHHLNSDDKNNEETQCMLILTSTHAVLLVANNDDEITKSWENKYILRCSGSVLIRESMSREDAINPSNGSKQLIYNNVKGEFNDHVEERLKHKKFSDRIGHLKLSESGDHILNSSPPYRTILVTGNDGTLQSVNGVVHAEQKLVSALNKIEKKFHVQNVWVAGCKRACNLCYKELTSFQNSRRADYAFEFESDILNGCQGSQRTVRYD